MSILFLLLIVAVNSVSANSVSLLNQSTKKNPKKGLCIKKCSKGPKTKQTSPKIHVEQTIAIRTNRTLQKACAQDELRVSCPVNQIISAKSVFVQGRWNYHACGSLDTNFNFRLNSIPDICIGKQSCSLKVLNHGNRQRAIELFCDKNSNATLMNVASVPVSTNNATNTTTSIMNTTTTTTTTSTTTTTTTPAATLPPQPFVQDIWIRARANVPISLSEVELFTEDGTQVKDKVSAIISTHGWNNAASPDKLFDGIKTSRWQDNANNQLSHTSHSDPNPYIKIQVTTLTPITRVVYYGRTDCCTDRMNGITVSTNYQGKDYTCSSDLGSLRRFITTENEQMYECYFGFAKKLNHYARLTRGPGRHVSLRAEHGGKLCGGSDFKCQHDVVTDFVISKIDASQVVMFTFESDYCADDQGPKVNCNRKDLGPWERFTLIEHVNSNTVSLRGGRAGSLCAWTGGKMECNRGAIGPWEKYTITFPSEYDKSTFPMMDKGSSANVRVKAESGDRYCSESGTGVTCTSTNASQFQLEKSNLGDRYALKFNGKYCADNQANNRILCNADAREEFSLVEGLNGNISLRSIRTGRYCGWNGSIIVCDRRKIGVSERFAFEFV